MYTTFVILSDSGPVCCFGTLRFFIERDVVTTQYRSVLCLKDGLWHGRVPRNALAYQWPRGVEPLWSSLAKMQLEASPSSKVWKVWLEENLNKHTR